MRTSLAHLLAALLLVPATLWAQEGGKEGAGEDRDAARLGARGRLLDTAHALAVAEGGTRRIGAWEGWLGAGGESVLPVQLFRGHSYHLVVGTGTDAEGLRVELFDGLGKRVEAETRSASGRIIVSLTPAATGTYYLRLHSEPDRRVGAVAVTYVYR